MATKSIQTKVFISYAREDIQSASGMKRMKLCRSCAKGIENKDLKKAVLAILADPLSV